MNNKFILNFTPTGMIPTKLMTRNVPIEPDEIVEQVLEVVNLGVNMVHIHARDKESGEPTYSKDVYAEIIGPIRKAVPDLVICVSLSGRDFFEFNKRSEALDLQGNLKPDFGSLTLSSLNFNQQASVNSPKMIQDLAKAMLERNIKPELEAFDLGMINYAHYLIRKKMIQPPYYFNLILGNIACAQANMLTLGLMVKELPTEAIWSAGGVGNAQLKTNAMSLIEGGGVRVGLEDNIWYDEERTKLATNRDLVVRTLKIAETLGRRPFTLKEARELLIRN